MYIMLSLDYPDVETTENNIGYVLVDLGQYDKAME